MKKLNKTLKNSEKAITLIALVITIIVLLILAGISISMLSGENGILQKATDSKERTERAEIVENARLDVLAKQTENKGTITEDELEEILLTFGVLSEQENILDRTLTSTKGNYQIEVSEIYNGNLAPEIDTGYGLYDANTGALKKSWKKLLAEEVIKIDDNGQLLTNAETATFSNSSSEKLNGKLVISDSVNSIGDNAFLYCDKLVEIVIPDSVTSFGRYAFAGCEMIERINIPRNVTVIKQNSFSGCTSLIEYTIPEWIQNIEQSAFAGSTNLTVTVPNSVNSVGGGAFGSVKQVYYNGTLNTQSWGAQKVNTY